MESRGEEIGKIASFPEAGCKWASFTVICFHSHASGPELASVQGLPDSGDGEAILGSGLPWVVDV